MGDTLSDTVDDASSSSTKSIDNAVELLAPFLGVDADSPEVEQLRQILGGPGLNTMAQLCRPRPAAVPAENAAVFMIPDRGAGLGLMMKQVSAHFVNCGWTARREADGVSYLPPAGASDEEIARVKRFAAAIMER